MRTSITRGYRTLSDFNQHRLSTDRHVYWKQLQSMFDKDQPELRDIAGLHHAD